MSLGTISNFLNFIYLRALSYELHTQRSNVGSVRSSHQTKSYILKSPKFPKIFAFKPKVKTVA